MHCKLVKEDGTPYNIGDLPTDETELRRLKLGISNWFNENQISGELLQGRYGIYTIGNDDWDINPIVKAKFGNLMNGLMFENISFERITGLALRLRNVMRSSFLNMQMFNSMPGGTPNDPIDTQNPWIELANVSELKMTFNSYILPHRIYAGDKCRRVYIYGAILDDPANYGSNFDTLGIDQVYGGESADKPVQMSQMFVTNSVVPYNMTKTITAEAETTTTKYIKDFLPNLKYGTTDAKYIDLPVLSTSLNVEVQEKATMNLNLSGLKGFAPMLYSVNVKISGQNTGAHGTLVFRTSDGLRFEEYNADGSPNNTTSKTITDSGIYSIQWLNNWLIRIERI